MTMLCRTESGAVCCVMYENDNWVFGTVFHVLHRNVFVSQSPIDHFCFVFVPTLIEWISFFWPVTLTGGDVLEMLYKYIS